ncbi:propionyl-CoA carboxylase [Thermosipho melanesiensis]|uniref:Biotin/lipoyl attachment domain-containing protein n=2 Tax=Thermosipho melanesiensis TaxID=46541 RepID=A6LKJ9_THEM4|nr:biotin/lipoyl-containing protein [Thermosipho melanesiensis]ABR30450.1 biotin/lipoyl attachment domain-containing protein [Thermosipho melanesiensis BI429]APT73610.1 propionyl-CoA carboxylase [Thermosipho melanesiensis]OOC37557.1 propionyl-CoA carboxylase [Thermosipho melanesiensis]OOC39453.1 propionyl-CoA carboxylase [Thermosipho melanesiensis]OOC39516.1 propionyl-CoA carboxylase [Thermosipho melanesiensis]
MVRKFRVRVNGKEYIVEVEDLQPNTTTTETQVKNEIKVETAAPAKAEEKVQDIQPKPASAGTKAINAPMSGIVLKVLVSQGQNVNPGDKVVVLEAMKMENEIISETSGKVKNILVKEGDNVDTGQALIELE